MKRVSPEEASRLMQAEGYVYVDVRSIPEFEDGHPEGAFNVPLLHLGPAGMAPNPDFVAVMERRFPKQARIVLGCRSGSRSVHAARLLEAAGYTGLVEQWAGFEGGVDPATGRPGPGWRLLRLPVAREALPDRAYAALEAS
jgi:rhodanese-related sulfurtransferase